MTGPLLLATQQTLDDPYLPAKSKMKKLILRINQKPIGVIDFEEGVYYTRKTIFRNFNGLSLSARVLKVLEHYEIENVEYCNLEHTYRTKVSKFFIYGEEYKDLKEMEDQLILSMEHFIIR